MNRLLESYHHVWLREHQNRSEAWLIRMLADGFHIHHIDGDHANDSPNNLVLIDGADHFLIHNGKKRPIDMVRKKQGDVYTSIERRAQERRQRNSLHNPSGKSKSEARKELLQRAVAQAKSPELHK